MSEEDIKVRAYYFHINGIGCDADDNYYLAKYVTERLQQEKCIETKCYSICGFCHSRYGSVIVPYIPSDNIICYECYIANDKKKIVDTYRTNYFNSHFETKNKQTTCKPILKNNKGCIKNNKNHIYGIKEASINNQFTENKKVHFNLFNGNEMLNNHIIWYT